MTRLFFGSRAIFTVLLLLALCTIKTHAIPPLEGGALNFQGYIVNDAGVPFGTEEEKQFYMRFSITPEDPNEEVWSLNQPILVSVRNGIFSVRLGKFNDDPDIKPLDERYFKNGKRFLRIEICDPSEGGCVPYSETRYDDFFRKFDLEGEELNPDLTDVLAKSQIPIPGVPFVVSSLRLVGNDDKQGTLRISRESDAPLLGEPAPPDLRLEPGQGLIGLQIFQNQNIGLLIWNPEKNSPDALVTENGAGKGEISGSLYLRGKSSLSISGSIQSTAERFGILDVRGLKPPGGKDVVAGSIKSPVFRNPSSEEFEASVTSSSRLHKLKIINPSLRTELGDFLKVDVSAKGNNSAMIEAGGSLELSDESSLKVQGTDVGRLLVSGDSPGITALGFYDLNQTDLSLKEAPYQVIPHGLSVFNTLTLGKSLQFSFERLKGLIGEFGAPNGVFEWTSRDTYTDSRTKQPSHTHDLRVGADPGDMIEKLNQRSGSTLISKRRIDNRLAFLFENNDGLTPNRPFYFTNTNFFNFYDGSAFNLSNPYLSPSIFTNNRIITSHLFDDNQEHFGIFLGGELNPRRVVIGSNYPDLGDLYFVHCAALGDCSVT